MNQKHSTIHLFIFFHLLFFTLSCGIYWLLMGDRREHKAIHTSYQLAGTFFPDMFPDSLKATKRLVGCGVTCPGWSSDLQREGVPLLLNSSLAHAKIAAAHHSNHQKGQEAPADPQAAAWMMAKQVLLAAFSSPPWNWSRHRLMSQVAETHLLTDIITPAASRHVFYNHCLSMFSRHAGG